MRQVSAGHSPIETFAFKAICRWGGVTERRTWNNPTREPWNPVIKACLNAIDHHTRMYLDSKNRWHLDRAQTLREYVSELKDWIHDCEGKT